MHPSAQEHRSRESLGSSGQEHTPGRVFQKAPVLTMVRRALPTRGWNQDRREALWPTPVRPIALWLTQRRCGMRPGWPGARSPWWSETCFGNVCMPRLVSWARRARRAADQHFLWAEGGTAVLSRAQQCDIPPLARGRS